MYESDGNDILEVLKRLPHRPPFILVDRILEYVPEKSIKMLKNVTINEPFFAGHFPENPIMPGVLIVEGLAQASVILAFKSMDQCPSVDDLYLFTGVDHVRFRRIVRPGDQLIYDIEFLKMRQNLMKVKAVATVDDELACSCEIMSVRR